MPTTGPTREPVPTNVRPTPPQPAPIEKPADPAKVRATFELGGQRVNVTEGEFYDCYKRLEKLEPKNVGRLLNAERVYEQILAYAEAKALGLEATPEEIALFDPLQRNPTLMQEAQEELGERRQSRRRCTTPTSSELRTIQKAKDLFVNSMRVLSSEVFDSYRRDHFTYRLEFVEFPRPATRTRSSRSKPTDAELEQLLEGRQGGPEQAARPGERLRRVRLVRSVQARAQRREAAPWHAPTPSRTTRRTGQAWTRMIPAEERSKLYPTPAPSR